jgi:polygalacturonase
MKPSRILTIAICVAAISFFVVGCRTEQPVARHAEKVTVYNVRAFGAVGNGTSLDSPAINEAIGVAAAAGGGTVLVPTGTYLCGSIHLKSNIHLVIDAGATILGAPQKMNAYDFTEAWPTNNPYQDGGHCYFHNSLIWGENLTNVFITGNGLINGGDLKRSDRRLDEMCGYSHSRTNRGQTYGAEVDPKTDAVRLGNKAIALKLCRNVLMRDITIAHGGHFAILATGCTDMTVDNVTMDTDRDGIDIDCCKNTMVSNCRINSPNDDGLCPKASFALGRNVATENLTIVNCQVSGFKEGTLLDGTMLPSTNHNGRIKFGTEANGGFRNCTVANCTFRGCKGLALEEVDGGIMDNITINNITMMDVPEYGIYVTTGKRNRGPAVTEPSVARNIFISNIIMDGVGKMAGIEITGIPEKPLEGIRLENIRLISDGDGSATNATHIPKELSSVRDQYPEPKRIGNMPAYGVFARHVKGLELQNITVSFKTNDLRSAIVCSDVDGLEIDNFKGQVADGVPVSRFDDLVKNVVIRNSPALQPKAN